MIKLSLFLMLAFSATLVSSKFGWGPCPKHDVVNNFDLSKYLGGWYEMYRIADVSFEKNLVCVTANYTKKTNGHVLVDNSGYNCKTKKDSKQLGDGKFRGKATEAKLGVKFFWWQPRGNYDVVMTDYENALVYSCTNLLICHFDFTWILSRSANTNTKTLQPFIDKAVQQKLVKSSSALLSTVQGDQCKKLTC